MNARITQHILLYMSAAFGWIDFRPNPSNPNVETISILCLVASNYLLHEAKTPRSTPPLDRMFSKTANLCCASRRVSRPSVRLVKISPYQTRATVWRRFSPKMLPSEPQEKSGPEMGLFMLYDIKHHNNAHPFRYYCITGSYESERPQFKNPKNNMSWKDSTLRKYKAQDARIYLHIAYTGWLGMASRSGWVGWLAAHWNNSVCTTHGFAGALAVY